MIIDNIQDMNAAARALYDAGFEKFEVLTETSIAVDGDINEVYDAVRNNLGWLIMLFIDRERGYIEFYDGRDYGKDVLVVERSEADLLLQVFMQQVDIKKIGEYFLIGAMVGHPEARVLTNI